MLAGQAAAGELTRAQVEAHARDLGLAWRTVERARHDGLVAGPVTHGLGQGRGSASCWPPETLHHLDTLARARAPGHRVAAPLLLHRLWWRGGRPDLYPRWQADRLEERLADWRAWRQAREQSSDAQEDDAAAWVQSYFSSRGLPYRKHVPSLADLDAPTDREALAAMLAGLNLHAALPAGVSLADRVDPDRKLTYGTLLGRTTGMPAELSVAVMAGIPPPNRVWSALRRLSEPGAAALRDTLEAMRLRAGERNSMTQVAPLRDAPRLAGMLVAVLAAWELPPPGDPEPATCTACGANFSASLGDMAVSCPTCGEVFQVVPAPDL